VTNLFQIDHEGNMGGYVNGSPLLLDKCRNRIEDYYCAKTLDMELVISDGLVSIKVNGWLGE
jgi:hypothetical protein